ncbi:MAG: 23S rRNA (adenine(2503)-C(2))-methyltransferase RlmN [Acidobacteria bacterium]|nr:23S rRNA (adenine(2503)-C(2))-methyltransferase RlmN [Acidobacteriota bacterium]
MTTNNLFGQTESQLHKILADQGEPAYRAQQVFAWLYKHRTAHISGMTNLPKTLRDRLQGQFTIQRLDRFQKFPSNDGSIKYVFQLEDGHSIEAVYMVMRKGITLCLSSQVGCAQACSFCQTAQMGFIRNLKPEEIIGQAEAITRDQEVEGPFNVVMMGMGEPLLNLPNLIKTLDVLLHPDGFDLSPKRVTVSTSGHVRNLLELAKYPKLPRIAISLNASNDDQRNELMPVNERWPIAELLDACRQLPIPPRDRITFEYVLLGGINDSVADAKRVVKLLQGLRCKINLIPFNQTPQLPYQQPLDQAIEAFHQVLERAGIINTIRWSKGRDVGAACGQLATPIPKPGARIHPIAPQV